MSEGEQVIIIINLLPICKDVFGTYSVPNDIWMYILQIV